MSSVRDRAGRRLGAGGLGAGRQVRGFSIVEMLVVILIIAVIISLIVPALGGARDAARRSDTLRIANEFIQASASFQLDHRKYPGYFSAREMGHLENETRGMTAMENAMVDLMQMKIVDPASPDAATALDVGPLNNTASRIKIALDRPNTAKSYFNPGGKYFQPQANDPAATRQKGRPGHAAATGQPQLPDFLDAFGSPFLLWVEDDASVGVPSALGTTGPKFTSMSFDPNQPKSMAKFYVTSNSAFFSANAFGRRGINMTTQDAAYNDQCPSALGSGMPDGEREASLAALLGDPNAPSARTGQESAIFPLAARASFVVHSAGVDGVPLSTKVSKSARGASYMTSKHLSYWNAANANADLWTQFDDVIIGTN